MKTTKKIITACTAALLLTTASLTAFAASYTTPAEAAAGITGRTVESVISEKNEGNKTYGTIAREAGKLEEFKAEMLQIQKNALSDMVAAGKITKEKADAILQALEANQAACDGSGGAAVGRNNGACFGSVGCGQGVCGANRGNGAGRGQGYGRNRNN